MAGFCGSCGAPRPAAGAYCEACGAAFATPSSGHAARAEANTPDEAREMMARLRAASTGEKVIAGAAGAAFLSLFLPWLDVGLATRNGWQELGWLWFGIVFSYPAYTVLGGHQADRRAYIALGFVGVALMLLIWMGNTESIAADGFVFLEDQFLDFNGVGVYLFAAAAIAATVGGFLHRPATSRP